MNYDQTSMPAAYDLGRSYSAAQLGRWLDLIAESVGGTAVTRIVDIGCGTGRYSGALAAHFDAPVIAIDPSARMLAQALGKHPARVACVRARAEALPLAASSADLVFMSMVLHHLDDAPAAIRESRRVLQPHGAFCLRAATAEQIDSYAYVPFFPGSRPLLAATFPPRAVIEATFAGEGLELARRVIIQSECAPSWNDYAARLVYRADSILARLTDREFERGMSALRDYARNAPDGPVTEPIDFLVFHPASSSSPRR